MCAHTHTHACKCLRDVLSSTAHKLGQTEAAPQRTGESGEAAEQEGLASWVMGEPWRSREFAQRLEGREAQGLAGRRWGPWAGGSLICFFIRLSDNSCPSCETSRSLRFLICLHHGLGTKITGLVIRVIGFTSWIS